MVQPLFEIFWEILLLYIVDEWLCPFIVFSTFLILNLLEGIPAVTLVLPNVQRKGRVKSDPKDPALLTKLFFLFDRVHKHQALYFSHVTIGFLKMVKHGIQ